MLLKAFLFLKFLLLKNVHTDNFVFRLYYRWTVAILVSFSFVITCRLFVGHSFSCIERNADFPLPFISMLCYSEGVYTNQISHYTGIVGRDMDRNMNDVKKYYSYYAWVNIVLLVQAFLFYLPHLLWTIYEKRYIFKLTAPIDNACLTEERRNMELCVLAKYTLITQGKHRAYVVFYIFMEFSNYIISLLHAVWVVCFFQVIKTPEIPNLKLESWSDFNKFYFPTRANCIYEYFGSSGDMQKHHALCLLPLNQMYMYIFLFLYSWYIFLSVLSGGVLVYRLCLFFSGLRAMILTCAAPLCNESELRSICDRLSYHDWFFLWRLKDNLADMDFAQLIDKIAVVSHGCKETDNNQRDQQMQELVSINTPM